MLLKDEHHVFYLFGKQPWVQFSPPDKCDTLSNCTDTLLCFIPEGYIKMITVQNTREVLHVPSKSPLKCGPNLDKAASSGMKSSSTPLSRK